MTPQTDTKTLSEMPASNISSVQRPHSVLESKVSSDLFFNRKSFVSSVQDWACGNGTAIAVSSPPNTYEVPPNTLNTFAVPHTFNHAQTFSLSSVEFEPSRINRFK